MFPRLRYFFCELKKRCFHRSFQPVLRVSHFCYSKKLDYEICVVQVIGKNAFAELDAHYLIQNPEMLRAFSHEDVVKITSLAESLKNQGVPTSYKIRKINTHDHDHKNIVIIEKTDDSKQCRAVTLGEIENNIALLSQFHPQEAFLLGRTKALQDAEEEKQMMRKIKNSHVEKNNIIDCKNLFSTESS